MSLYEEDLPASSACLRIFDNALCSDTVRFRVPIEYIKMQIKLAGLKYFPYDLKRFCIIAPDYLYANSQKKLNTDSVFSWDNTLFYETVNNREIETLPDKCFKFIHLCGTHEPYDYTAEIDSNYSGTYEDSIDLCINLIDIYLNMLKESNIYDKTAVIILGDHGSSGPVYFRQNPAFFVKGIDEHHSFSTSLAPISYSDLNTCFMRLMDGCIGDQLFDAVPCDVRERRFLSPYVIDDEHIVEFFQKGYAWDEETMVESGILFNKNSTSAT